MGSEQDKGPGLGAAPQVLGKQRMKAGIRAALFGDMDTLGGEAEPDSSAVPESLGRFRVLSELGRGGMGEVYAAYDPELDRKVAIKLLRRDVSEPGSESQGPSRLQREAQAMARVNHPNVATVHEVATFDGRLYVAMEFVDGGTLRQWIQREEPSTEEILSTFVQAAHGLAAAHDAGLVHRDFKPDNVLISKAGRVKVVDFGLARAAVEIHSEEATSSHRGDVDPMVTPLTRTGAVMGTPAYMSPEQHSGRAADARSDQFSFCVALWEALMGERPFAGATYMELSANVVQGVRCEPVAGRAVSGRILAALDRGLSVHPQERFDTMHELVVALLPPSRMRLWIAGTAALGVAALVGTWVTARETVTEAGACDGVQEQLAGVWDDQRRAATKTTVLSSGHPNAQEGWESIQRQLDAYAELWLQAAGEVCAAGQLESSDPEVYARRQRCLDSRRAELDAMVGVFDRADPAVVMAAVQAVVSLSDVRDCSDERRLAAWRIPRQPEAQRELAEVRADIAAAKVRGLLASYDEAVDMARQAAARGRHLDDPATEAAALLIEGQYLERGGQLQNAESVLSRAVKRADVAEAYETKVKALNVLVHVVGTDPNRYDEAKSLASEARTVLRVLGADPLLEAELDLNLGGGARRAKDFKEARRLFESSLRGFKEHAGELHLNTARAESNLGLVLSWQEEFAAAEEHLIRSRQGLESSLGPSHPSVGTAWNVLGTNSLLQKRYEEAVDHYRRALEIQTKNFPDGHRNVMLAHYNVGIGLFNLRRYDEALKSLQASLEVRGQLSKAAQGKTQSWVTMILLCQLNLGRHEDARATAEGLLADPEVPRTADIVLPAAMALFPVDPERARTLVDEVAEGPTASANQIQIDGMSALLDSLDQLRAG